MLAQSTKRNLLIWASLIIFFQDARAFKEFTSGNFEFGAKASAVAITAGASAGAGTSGTGAGVSGGKKDAVTAGAYPSRAD